jgi:succinate-semialdehyde dehydrogenase/glutarate-semialdehyde dehydrogenase
MAIATIDPATGELVQQFDPASPERIEAALAASATGFDVLRRTSFTQRAEWMIAAAEILDAEVDSVAATMTTEMGKTLASAKAEVAKCAKGYRHYAAHAGRYLADEPADPAAVGASALLTYSSPGAAWTRSTPTARGRPPDAVRLTADRLPPPRGLR